MFKKKYKVEDPVEQRFDAMMELIKDLPKTDYKIYPKNKDYIVSSSGKVYSINYNHTGKVKELKQYLNNKGYYFATIYSKEKKKQISVYIHRLVAETFIDNNDNKPEINHIDGNPRNNDASNLEWVTRSENEFHKNRVLEHRRKGIKILCVETKEVFNSYHEAGRKKGIYPQNIYKVIKGYRSTCGGYHWRKYDIQKKEN